MGYRNTQQLVGAAESPIIRRWLGLVDLVGGARVNFQLVEILCQVSRGSVCSFEAGAQETNPKSKSPTEALGNRVDMRAVGQPQQQAHYKELGQTDGSTGKNITCISGSLASKV